jgi:hypothetical protein
MIFLESIAPSGCKSPVKSSCCDQMTQRIYLAIQMSF